MIGWITFQILFSQHMASDECVRGVVLHRIESIASP